MVYLRHHLQDLATALCQLEELGRGAEVDLASERTLCLGTGFHLAPPPLATRGLGDETARNA